MADPYIKRFYEEINAYWIKNRNGTLRHVNIVSIGGGHRDVMVRSDLVAMPWKEVSDLDVAVIVSCFRFQNNE